MFRSCVPSMVQSSRPKDLIIPARTHIRNPTAVQVRMKNAIPTPQTGGLLSSMVAATRTSQKLKKDGETEKQKMGGRRALSGRQGGEKQLKRGMACNNHPCTGQVLAARATIRARMRGRSKAQIAQHGSGMLRTVSTHHGSAVSTSRERGRPTFGIANRRLIRTPNALHDRVSWQMQLSARSATLFHGNRWTAGTAGVGGSQRLLEG